MVAVRLAGEINNNCSFRVSFFLIGLYIGLYSLLEKKKKREKAKENQEKNASLIDTKAVLSLINHSLCDLFATSWFRMV